MADIERCFGGAIPAVMCTVSADGTPNVTYLTKAHRVDDERIALSNQFMSKTARNLAANPWASLLLIDPVSYNEYRLTITYERTDRKGRVFDRLRKDVDDIAPSNASLMPEGLEKALTRQELGDLIEFLLQQK